MTQWNLWFRGSSGSSCYRPSSPGKWRQVHGALVWRQGNTPRRFNTSTKAGSPFFFKGCAHVSVPRCLFPWLAVRSSAQDRAATLGLEIAAPSVMFGNRLRFCVTSVRNLTYPKWCLQPYHGAVHRLKNRNHSCQTLLIHSPAGTYVLKTSVYHWTLSKYHAVLIKLLPLNLPLEISVVCENTRQSILGTYQICMHVLNEVFPFCFWMPPHLSCKDQTQPGVTLSPTHAYPHWYPQPLSCSGQVQSNLSGCSQALFCSFGCTSVSPNTTDNCPFQSICFCSSKALVNLIA